MIRILQADDVASFRSLRLLALQESPNAFGSTYNKEAGKSLDAVTERIRPREDGSIVCGFFSDANELIGIIGFARDDGPKERHKAFIWGMYVHPEHRRQRIGFQLINHVIQYAKCLPDMRQIKLTVTSSNKAAANLYTQLGFIPYGIEKDSLASGDGFLDECFMALRLC